MAKKNDSPPPADEVAFLDDGTTRLVVGGKTHTIGRGTYRQLRDLQAKLAELSEVDTSDLDAASDAIVSTWAWIVAECSGDTLDTDDVPAWLALDPSPISELILHWRNAPLAGARPSARLTDDLRAAVAQQQATGRLSTSSNG